METGCAHVLPPLPQQWEGLGSHVSCCNVGECRWGHLHSDQLPLGVTLPGGWGGARCPQRLHVCLIGPSGLSLAPDSPRSGTETCPSPLQRPGPPLGRVPPPACPGCWGMGPRQAQAIFQDQINPQQQWARPRWKRLLRVLLSETGPACPTAPSSVLPGTWAVCGTCQPSSHAATGDRIPCTSRPKTSQAATGTQDWPFDDGAPPPGKVVEDWLSLVKAKFCEAPGSCVAVHCVAGLGRAPVLVALALIESGMKYEDAIQFIRQKRRGAINSKQLTYLEKYRPKQRLRFKDPQTHKTRCCVM
ncbi:protein tyrosine phosphatase type IVA 3 isoform X1 [Saimiri boliviensis]|uniref:protein tyrosine phosphatase type IVA 3 isoform X1 n=1 Tax=Saimiri boliviensis TaxID=27679 RepID=UPI003D7776F8